MKRQSIAVVGAGVVGLTTAITLARRGHAVTLIGRDPNIIPRPASAVAPAMFTPYPPPPGTLAAQRFAPWTRTALEKLRELAGQGVGQTGVSIGELREYGYAPHRLEGDAVWMEELLATKPLSVSEPFLWATTSTRPHIDMLRYMPWLRKEAKDRGCTLLYRPVERLDEPELKDFSTIVNCTGIGARALTTDTTLRPMHGLVLHVPNDIGLKYSLHDDARGPEGKVAYIFRFNDRLVLGGTFDDGTPERSSVAEAGILRRCRNLLRIDGGVGKRWEALGETVIERRSAERPTRGSDGHYEDLRVERDSQDARIIHHYGHGRMGATISWGTAAEVADML